MSKMETDLFEKCFEKWGNESQFLMLIEECAELIQATNKDMLRNDPERSLRERFEHFAEELADTQLMIDEMIYRFELKSDIEYWRMVKLERVEKLLKEDKKT